MDDSFSDSNLLLRLESNYTPALASGTHLKSRSEHLESNRFKQTCCAVYNQNFLIKTSFDGTCREIDDMNYFYIKKNSYLRFIELRFILKVITFK